MSAKLTTSNLVKINMFLNKENDVIFFGHAVIKKILSSNLIYIVDVVMSRKFGNSSASTRGVIITSIL